MIITEDNNYTGESISEKEKTDLSLIADKTIADIVKNWQFSDLLIYPESFSDNTWKDDVDESSILSIDGDVLKTGNIVGFIGVRGEDGTTELSIHSRFTNNEEDYFLHYMLQRIMSINMFDWSHSFTDRDPVFDFLKFLFPAAIKEALSQGVYKEYVKRSYNDPYVHGAIDIASFIKKDIPFNGRIASTAREHNYDNSMTELIRHAIEVIRQDPIGRGVLSGNKETVELVRLIESVTPSYNKNERGKVLAQNLRTKIQPYFTKYRQLQRLCIQILRHEGLKYTSSEDKKKVYGILFDCAWLWEEYLNSIFRDRNINVIHPENKAKSKGIQLFTDNSGYPRYPDFYMKDEFLVMDAKYKRMRKESGDSEHNSIERNDMHQMISYMYCLRSQKGVFLFPNEKTTELKRVGTLDGYGGEVSTCSLKIPGVSAGCKYRDFETEIRIEEKQFVDNILGKVSVL